jgi:hypothetical protein
LMAQINYAHTEWDNTANISWVIVGFRFEFSG